MSNTNTEGKPLTRRDLKVFAATLQAKRHLVLQHARALLQSEAMQLRTDDLPDEMDLASSEYLQSVEFRLRGRESSLLGKLDAALQKIGNGSFGRCDNCDGQIGKKRLEARPETTLCINCKEEQEREERTMA